MVEINKKIENLARSLEQKGFEKEALSLRLMIKSAQDLYTVRSGDTLSRISGGDPRYQKLIEEANPDLNPNRLQIGQKIKLPQKPKYPNKNLDYGQGLIDFIKKYEGRPDAGHRGEPYLQAYDDGFGNITIGWGHKLGRNIDLNDVQSINPDQAEKFLRSDLDEAADFVKRNVDAKLNENQFEALTSLVFNAGANAVYKTPLFKAIDEGRFSDAAKLFPTTLIGQGQPGLQKRRVEETAMFQSGTGTY